MTTHTPGPWFTYMYGPSNQFSIGSDSLRAIDGSHIAVAIGISDGANASLIAAAPDTYAVCKMLEEFNDDMGSPAWTKMLENARAALAKAESR